MCDHISTWCVSTHLAIGTISKSQEYVIDKKKREGRRLS